MTTAAKWLAALAIALAIGAVAGHGAVEEADSQDAEALTSREWAGQHVCGPHATPEWLNDKTLQCLRHVDPTTAIAQAANEARK